MAGLRLRGEHPACWDLAGIEMRAAGTGPDATLTGEKTFVLAGLAADVLLVVATAMTYLPRGVVPLAGARSRYGPGARLPRRVDESRGGFGRAPRGGW